MEDLDSHLQEVMNWSEKTNKQTHKEKQIWIWKTYTHTHTEKYL